jgi:diguanylate cyclase (GGDEF)-like protein
VEGLPLKLRRYVPGGYAVWMVLLVATYYAVRDLRPEAWGLIGLSGVAAILAGVVVNRPSRKAPWLLLAAALTSFTAGQVSFLIMTQILRTSIPFPSFADVLYLSAYPLYATGMAIFIWWRAPYRDRRSLIDALTLTAGLALLSWIFLILPYVHNPELSWLQKSVAIAYPLGGVLILALIARLVGTGTVRARCFQLLTLGALGGLASDVAFGLVQLHGSFPNGTVIDLGWAVFYGAWGAAALHPTMAELTHPASRQQVDVSPARLAAGVLASLIAPAVLFAESFRRQGTGASVIGVFSAILYLLVLIRLWDVAASHRRTLRRERVVRQAGVSLVTAVTVEEVAVAVKSATDTLLGGRARGDVLFAVRTDGALRAVRHVRALPSGCDWMLLCPLTLGEGDPLIGLLALFGEQRILADLSAPVEILAHQAALAVERIMLRDEVIRQGNEAYFRTLVQDTSDTILIIRDDGKIRYATPSAASIFGDIAADGAYLWDLVAASERDDLIHTISQLEEKLEHQAFHDALTGLPNRLLLADKITQRLAAAKRDGTTAGVLFVDLDDFKVVNDTMGHGVGDELLVAAAARLASLIRDSDTAARLGGDEFALLIGDAEDSAAAEAAADRVVRAFGEPFVLAGGSVITTVTVGVATTQDSADTDDLFRHADLALYAAKAAGKRQWRRYQPVLSAGMVRRRELQAALENAVARSEFTIAYQPIISLTGGQLVGFEALIRWPHAQWGMIQPEQFIALAEETGQIVSLGSWVLAQATADIARWQPRRRLYVSVNVSARQFSAPGFVDSVRRVIAMSGLRPGELMLELTESVLLCRDERLHSDLVELKSIGVKLAIDDFGTGYSSLSYLRELPIDVLKMDKSFVDGIAVSEQRLALAEGIVQIARTLRLEVIAEGIESEVQRDLLTSMGCQFGQGYLLAMPMATSQAEAVARIGSQLVPQSSAGH